MFFYLELVLRLLIAAVLGGIIGYEREHTNRPAGFRTHILVCVGAALVMVTSEFIFDRYHAIANIDPARLGAQVISGIGFLGAGTIIRDGFNVKGLTTAASLWAVSCVGIAAGIGFYEGAVIATVLIFLTLIFLKKAEMRFFEKSHLKTLLVESENLPGQIGMVSSIFEKYNIEIRNIDFVYNDNRDLLLKFILKLNKGHLDKQAVDELQRVEGVKKVAEE